MATRKHQIERVRVRSPFRVAYVFVAPTMFILGLYLSTFLGLNSREGSVLLSRVLTEALSGSIEFAYLRVAPNLLSVTLYDARLSDLDDRPAIEVARLACRFAPGGLFRRRIMLEDCDGERGRVLAYEYDDGAIGIDEAFEGEFRPKRQPRDPPVVSFTNINLVDVDVLIALRDMMLRFDDVSLMNGSVEIGRNVMEISADARAEGGRILVTEPLVGFDDADGSWDMVEWNILRRTSPWRAAYARVPGPSAGGRGVLDLPLDTVLIDGMRWRDEDIDVSRLLLAGPEVAFDGAGLLRLMPERPKLAPRERSVISYDGRARLAFGADSAALDWVLPGVFGSIPDAVAGGLEPMVFDGYGSVRFFEGETRLNVRDVRLLGWRLDSLDAGLSWHEGTMALSGDAHARMFGGEITGTGWLESETGQWQLLLCADDLDLGMASAPYVVPGLLADLLSAHVSTSPSQCGAVDGWASRDLDADAIAPGLILSGDLTLKALEVDPARDTPPDKEIQPPMIEGVADGLLFRWDQPPAGLPLRSARVSVGASLSQRGVLRFARPAGHGLVVRSGSEELTVDGALDTIDAALERTKISLRSTDFGPWIGALGGPTLAGLSLTTSLTAEGPLGAPRVTAVTLSGGHTPGGARDGLPLFTYAASLEARGDRLLVEAAQVRSPLGDVEASGWLDLFDGSVFNVRPDPPLGLDVALSGLDVGGVVPSLGLDASITTRFDVTGTPSSPRVSGGDLELLEFRLFGEPIDYLYVGSYVLSDDVVVADNVFAVKGKGTLEGAATIDFGARTLDATARGRRFRLGELRRAAELGARLHGDVDFDVGLGGTFDAPLVSGRASVTGLRAQGLSLGGAAVTFYTFDGAVEIAAEVATDLDVAARIPLDGGPWTVAGGFSNAPIEAHVTRLDRAIGRSALTGTFAAELDPLGTGDLRGDVELTSASLVLGGREFDVSQPAHLGWVAATAESGGLEHRVELSGLRIGTTGRYLDVGGRLLLTAESSDLEADIEGDSDFSLLQLLPDLIVDAEGLAHVSLRVRGPLEDPAIDGAVSFESARIAPRGLGTSVLLGPGRLRVADRAIVADESAPLVGTVFGGDFTAWGSIGLSGLIPSSVDYHMFATNVAYRIPGVANVTFTSDDLRFVAPALEDPDTWALSGDIEVVDARYYDDIEVVGSALSFGGFGRTVDGFSVPVWMSVPTLGAINVDLTIRGRDRFLVENTIATAELDMEFRTDLRLTGTFNAMDLVGEMEALEGGTVTYRGRTFDVSSATLTFRGVRDELGYPMPSLDSEMIAAIRPCVRQSTASTFESSTTTTSALDTTGDVFITAVVRGQLPYDLTFQLESTPFYDQRDQLSLILTGCTVDALTANDAGGRTLEVVLAPVIDVVERNVEERLDLDQVDLTPSSSGSAGISIQDEVSERFRWGLDATVGAEAADNRQVIRGEYRLFDWLLVEVEEQTSQSESITFDTGLRFRVKLD